MSVKMPILLQIALSVTTAGYCGVGVGGEKGNTTCYIYKNNKLK